MALLLSWTEQLVVRRLDGGQSVTEPPKVAKAVIHCPQCGQQEQIVPLPA